MSLIATVIKMRDIFDLYHHQMTGRFLHSFPQDSCEPASTLAYIALKKIGYIDTRMYRGDLETDNAHFWLKTEGLCIDMTYDQEMIAGSKLYGFSPEDLPYSNWDISEVPHEDILKKINRFQLDSDIENFMHEIKSE